MTKKRPPRKTADWPRKAYRNPDFLTAPEGRIVRVLSEFMEPAARFGKLHIHDTIVFFGSARTLPEDEARKNLEALEGRVASKRRPSRALLQECEGAKKALAMSRYYEDAVQLERRLSELGVAAVHEALGMIAQWDGYSPLGVPQDPQAATKARRLKKTDGEVDWNRSARQIANQVRALKPWPGTFTTWQRPDGEAVRLILDRVSVAAEATCSVPLGEVVLADNRDSELERAQAVWQKKFGSAPTDMAEKVRQMRFLQSRGFGAEVIRRVVHDAADA